MRLPSSFFTLLILSCGSIAPVSFAGTVEDSPKLKRALEWLNKSPSGKKIVERAHEMNIPIQEGKVSKTEMTATRTSDGNSESLKFSTQVLIARDKDPVFQALDLAHELTHATHPNTNPFDPALSAEKYVRHGIEGEGGEAQAILQECTVGKELLGFLEDSENGQLVKARCQFVWKTESDINKWNRSFYQLGQHYHAFLNMVAKLGVEPGQKSEWTQKVESRSPMFSSAVTHKPYPLALLEEYVQITQKICEKSPARNIASVGTVIHALTDRCQSIQNIP